MSQKEQNQRALNFNAKAKAALAMGILGGTFGWLLAQTLCLPQDNVCKKTLTGSFTLFGAIIAPILNEVTSAASNVAGRIFNL